MRKKRPGFVLMLMPEDIDYEASSVT